MTADYFVADLRALAAKLKNKERFKRFCGCVDRMHAISSAKNDLRLAKSCVKRLVNGFVHMEQVGETEQLTDPVVGNALFSTAVVFYGRATDTPSTARRPSGIRDKLPKELLVTHKQIMGIRNDAVAHFSGGGDGWSKDAVVAKFKDNAFRIFTPWSSFHFRGHVVRDFAELIEGAFLAADEIELKALNLMNAEISRLGSEESLFDRELRATEFDPTSVYYSEAAIKGWYEDMETEGPLGNRDTNVMRTSGLGPANSPAAEGRPSNPKDA